MLRATEITNIWQYEVSKRYDSRRHENEVVQAEAHTLVFVYCELSYELR